MEGLFCLPLLQRNNPPGHHPDGSTALRLDLESGVDDLSYTTENPCASTAKIASPPPRLKDWLPIPIDAKTWASDLSDYETGWFWSLIFSSLVAEPQGYLLNSSNLWTIAGAKRSDFWQSHKSRVLARFEVREVDGIQMLCFPPLVEIITVQIGKLRNHRPRAAPLSHSLDSDPDLKKQGRGRANPAQTQEPPHESGAGGPSTLDRLFGR